MTLCVLCWDINILKNSESHLLPPLSGLDLTRQGFSIRRFRNSDRKKKGSAYNTIVRRKAFIHSWSVYKIPLYLVAKFSYSRCHPKIVLITKHAQQESFTRRVKAANLPASAVFIASLMNTHKHYSHCVSGSDVTDELRHGFVGFAFRSALQSLPEEDFSN